jgi:hypothetical protein
MEIPIAEFLDYKADDNEYDIGWEYSDIMQFDKWIPTLLTNLSTNLHDVPPRRTQS